MTTRQTDGATVTDLTRRLRNAHNEASRQRARADLWRVRWAQAATEQNVRGILGIVYCEKCAQDTIPEARSGRCFWCDTLLDADAPSPEVTVRKRGDGTRVCPQCGGEKNYQSSTCWGCYLAREVKVFEHGTEGRYNRGCKCDGCRSAANKARRLRARTARS